MSLNIGIVGLPNVGKSTLFNALTKANILTANYPFATIEPNTGIVPVPDGRLDVLGEMYDTERIVPATIEFVDIAGLVAGASKGEGLGNKFLANIRECDAICHVVRAFADSSILSVEGAGDVARDIATIETELVLADIESLEKHIPKLEKEAKNGGREKVEELNYYKELLDKLKGGDGRIVSSESGVLGKFFGLPLLSQKPTIFLFNVSEDDLFDVEKRKELAAIVAPAKAVFVSAKLEEELGRLPNEDREMFLAEYNLTESGLAQVVRAAYDTLGLQSFLTAGKKETRAWTIRKGFTAPQAAGVIHTDFEWGFISAQICNFDDLVRLGSEKNVKENGLMRTEGKEYVMRDGDVVEFRFNV
ncbi:MAG: redox-regulated ATPase YchF [Candidatus Nomurabacteria bacterium]|jgi:GTP-binding protein YchF|nr:redox-regulated ATPase YchF [Candidatus Nomurabacteria bacterium]